MLPRQMDLERGACARLAVDPDVATALFDDAIHSRKAEARAIAFGREEGLENPSPRLLIHTMAHVSDHKLDVGSGLCRHVVCRVLLVDLDVGGLDGELAALGHGVARVNYKVHE